MSTANRALRCTYQGWSGWLVEPTRGAVASTLCIDPAPDAALPAGPLVVLITHGHPEHVLGARSHLGRTERDPVDVVAARGLCRHLRPAASDADRFHEARPGDRLVIGGWQIEVFAWDHMSLLPPEPRRAIAQLSYLLSRPTKLAKIAVDGLFGPPHGPMLGYRIGRAQAELVYLGEGLHRRTSERVLAAALSGGAPTLIAGVEPEDAAEIPPLLASRPLGRMLAFEPHRDWRAEFGMPQIDLADLVVRLRAAGVDSSSVLPGQTLVA